MHAEARGRREGGESRRARGQVAEDTPRKAHAKPSGVPPSSTSSVCETVEAAEQGDDVDHKPTGEETQSRAEESQGPRPQARGSPGPPLPGPCGDCPRLRVAGAESACRLGP